MKTIIMSFGIFGLTLWFIGNFLLTAEEYGHQPIDQNAATSVRWSASRARNWYQDQKWPVGANYIPASAVNQLEMWQAETFDKKQIDKELGWASEIGLNTLRVFLHHLLWEQDPDGLIKRMDEFLSIADQNGIKIMFVFFDDVWDPYPKSGKQAAPIPHVHNSGWVQSPGVEILRDTARHGQLENYVKGVLRHFENDQRILIWDLYNEPGNGNANSYGEIELKEKSKYSLILLKLIAKWAREINPQQPITIGAWTADWLEDRPSAITKFCLEQSDIISFHTYHLPKKSPKTGHKTFRSEQTGVLYRIYGQNCW